MSFLDDLEKFEQDEKQAIKDQRMAECGKYHGTTVGPHGELIVYTKRCKDPRCPYCQGVRADQIKARVEMGLGEAGRPLRMIQMDAEEAREWCRAHKSREYFRIPCEDGTDVIFANVDEDIGILLNQEIFEEINWRALAKQVPGRNLSGKLGKNQHERGDEPEATIEVVDFKIDNLALGLMVAEEVVQETSGTKVTSESELQEAVNRRVRLFEQKYRARGGAVLGITRRKQRTHGFFLLDTVINKEKSLLYRKSFQPENSLEPSLLTMNSP